MAHSTKLGRLLSHESTVGVLLVVCALLSMGIANSAIGNDYRQIWSQPIGGHPLAHWINDGLMAVFFLLVGLEIKKEVLFGSLRTPQQALVPLLAAVGGMVVPAVLYMVFNWGENTWRGFGIPMATDIAFVLAVLAVLGSRVPKEIKVFLTTLAVVDDLGAILVIALFYSTSINIAYLMLALAQWGLLCLLGLTAYPRRKSEVVTLTLFLIIGGVVMWVLLMKSGVHASLAGILLAIAVPTFDNHPRGTANQWQKHLHGPVYWLVLPLFVLANTAIGLDSFDGETILSPMAKGISGGLLLGKPAGILLGILAAMIIGKKSLPQGIAIQQWIGAACLGGIGFTMSIFVTSLAFDNPMQIEHAKAVIVSSSVVAALLGGGLLATSRNAKKYRRLQKIQQTQKPNNYEKVHL